MYKLILSLLVLAATNVHAALPPAYERIREIQTCVEAYAKEVMNYKSTSLVPVSEIKVINDYQITLMTNNTMCLFSLRNEGSGGMVGPGKLVAIVLECGAVRADVETVPYSKVLKVMESSAAKGRTVKSVVVGKRKLIELKFQ